MAETKVAELAFDAFIESYALKYEKAADCLSKDRDTLLAFYVPGRTGNTCRWPPPLPGEDMMAFKFKGRHLLAKSSR